MQDLLAQTRKGTFAPCNGSRVLTTRLGGNLVPPFLDKLIRCHREFLGNLSRPVPIQVLLLYYSIVQSLSHVLLSATLWTAARQVSLSITNSRNLFKLMSIETVMPSNHLILCHPLFLLPLIFPGIRVFSNESVLCIRWPKY